MDNISKKYLTSQDVSEIYSIPVGTLANWRYLKIGPKYYKVRRKVLYMKADVEKWIKTNLILTVDSLE